MAKVDLPIPAAARPRPYVAKSVGGTTFTKEEIDLLIGMADDIKNIDEDQAISAWEAWAAEASIALTYLLQYDTDAIPLLAP